MDFFLLFLFEILFRTILPTSDPITSPVSCIVKHDNGYFYFLQVEFFDDEVDSGLLETAGDSDQEEEAESSTSARRAGQEAAGPQFPAGPATPAGQPRSVEAIRTSTPNWQSRGSSRSSGEPDSRHGPRRAHQRVGANTTAVGASGDIVMSLQDIGESVGVIEDPDQLFWNAIVAELGKHPEDVKRRIKGDICRVVYG